MHLLDNDPMSWPATTPATPADPPDVDAATLLEALVDSQPAAALARIRSLVTVSHALRATIADRLDDAIAGDRLVGLDADRIVGNAARAQETFENWNDERVDRLLA